MEIYKDEFIQFFHDKDNSIISFHWSKNTERIIEYKFKSLLTKGLELLKTHPSKYLISDHRQQKFVVVPELQKWIATEILPNIFKYGIVKYAIIESEEFVFRLATEMTIKEDKQKKYDVQFFNNIDKAKKWFNE